MLKRFIISIFLLVPVITSAQNDTQKKIMFDWYTNSNFQFVDNRARIANQTNSWTGTVRTVGSGKTYSTITAAYAACNSGDIIEIYGTINTSSEAGGYLLMNRAGISVLVRGGSGNKTVDIINQTSANLYNVRLRDGGTNMMFQDLTIQTNQVVDNMWAEFSRSIRNLVIKNCNFISTNGTGGKLFTKLSDGASTGVRLEFDGVSMTSSAATPIYIEASKADAVHLFTNSTIVNNGTTSISVQYVTANLGTIAMYNNTITQASNQTVVNFGLNGPASVNDIALVDFRENTITGASGFGDHAVMFGSDTDNVYAVNNTVSIPANSSSTDGLGFVIKTIASTVNNAQFMNNTLTAKRPFYLKGAQNIVAKYNTATCRANANGAFEFVNVDNGVSDVMSTGNVITNNRFLGGAYGLLIYDGGASEEEDVTIKTNTIDYNTYSYSNSYLFNSRNSTGYSLANRAAFWGVIANDIHSGQTGL